MTRNRNKRRVRGGAGRALWAVLLAIPGLLGAWLVLKVTAAEAFRGPASAHYALSAGNPYVQLDHVMLEAERTGGRPSDSAYVRASDAAVRIPIAEEPFLVHAFRAHQRGDAEAAARLLNEARARNPRLRLARLFLLDHYFQTGRVQEAATEVAVLSRLLPESSPILVPEIARIARDRRFTAAIKEALRGDPIIDSVLTELVQAGADPEMILQLASVRPVADQPAHWQALLIERMVEQGRIGRAREIWLRLTPGAEREAGLIYDPGFERKAGVAPFNWTFGEHGAGVAGPAGRGTLEVVYYGREAAELARQLLLLPAGAYRLNFAAEGDAKGDSSRVEWQLACASGDRGLMSLPLRNVTYSPRRFAADFSVPAGGCDAQWLRLVGISAEFPERQLVQLSGLELNRAGSR